MYIYMSYNSYRTETLLKKSQVDSPYIRQSTGARQSYRAVRD